RASFPAGRSSDLGNLHLREEAPMLAQHALIVCVVIVIEGRSRVPMPEKPRRLDRAVVQVLGGLRGDVVANVMHRDRNAEASQRLGPADGPQTFLGYAFRP